MVITKFINRIRIAFSSLYQFVHGIRRRKHYRAKLDCFIEKNVVPELDRVVFSEVKNYWRRYVNHKVDDAYYRVVSCVRGNERLHEYVDEGIMFQDIIRKLNPMNASKVLSNKGMYSILFSDIVYGN